SAWWMAHRLCRVDARPIDYTVDATNYVMFDLGQPLHAFDAATLAKSIGPRWARPGEKLVLLDGATLELDAHDMVIADDTKPLALAGIMGGAASGVTVTTTSLLVEAACFDATTIRRSAWRHKIRTEASARFEKTLYPVGIIAALERFVCLLAQGRGSIQTSDIMVCGKNPAPVIITISHTFIESRLGIQLQPSVVGELLHSIAFAVVYKEGTYTITVPSFRATKDITIKEDILEEIGRLIGFESIAPVLPYKPLQPSDVTPVLRVREIKRIMATALGARELYTYAFYDEEFLRQLQWQPDARLEVQNPVSEHWRRLVTSLVPHLIKAVAQNAPEHDTLRFFEWARTWTREGDKGIEKKSLAAIFFDKKQAIDFYHAKEMVTTLLAALDLSVTWQRVDSPEQPWFMPYQTATLWHGTTKIGIAGKVRQPFLHTVAEGDAFIMELEGDFLESYKRPLQKYVPASKYPEVLRDISMLMPLQYTVDELMAAVSALSPRIVSVALVDFFTKQEWTDKRSLTLRLTLQDEHKTLTKEEVDQIVIKATDMLTSKGAVVR
ncbi:MAG TPA: phenylalanine--tRNA ligase subunit beta, partial [Candidatus Limnocylindria bacterium]|nr:phenylalanine--tRNA ligase subunit beta [Candidatus Limnocylindria bacterium]